MCGSMIVWLQISQGNENGLVARSRKVNQTRVVGMCQVVNSPFCNPLYDNLTFNTVTSWLCLVYQRYCSDLQPHYLVQSEDLYLATLAPDPDHTSRSHVG